MELITLAIKQEIGEHETEEMRGYKACAGPLRKLLDNHFYDYYQDHLHTEFDRRDLSVCREKEEYRTRFHDASAEPAAAKAREQRKKGKAVKVRHHRGCRATRGQHQMSRWRVISENI
jgi:hypothetical protein